LQVSASGGTPQPLTALDSANGEVAHVSPEILPDGKAFVFTAWRGNGDQIVVQHFETGERRVLVQDGSSAHYVATGHLVYVREGTLLAVPFDLASLEVTGAPVPFIEGVMQGSSSRHAAFSISRSGSLVYVSGDSQAERTLVWVDRQGAVEPLPAPLHGYDDPRLSPDGQRLAVQIQGGDNDVWIYDIPRNTLTRLTFEGLNGYPLWTPDGERVTFSSIRGGTQDLFWIPADGSGTAERLTTSEYGQYPLSWSPDGHTLVYYELHPTSGGDLWLLPFEGEHKPQPFLQTPFHERSAVFSPDGKWLAYSSDESGRYEIYVRPFAGGGGKWQISTESGTEPVWARNGRELFYRNGDQLMAVDITTKLSFSAGTPRLLFEGQYYTNRGTIRSRADYDITSDGQRFLMIQEGGTDSEATQINVVLNWFEELKQRVPTN
ncbi:MAG: hypothetical protein O7E51_03130, partial [Acidobacteria bacterium]|nr:hypothetical protein [Acidobacteriota bacterium]